MCKYAELIDNSHMCMIDGRPCGYRGDDSVCTKMEWMDGVVESLEQLKKEMVEEGFLPFE